MKEVVILLGIQGSGKGTQAKFICEKFGYKQISTGNLLRQEEALGSELGKEIAALIDKGNLVSDELVLEILKKEIKNGKENGFVLDGFPRTLKQAEMLDECVNELGIKIKKVVLIELDENSVLDRIRNRVSCSKCGAVYNLKSCKPKKDGVCDVCGAKLDIRVDDKKIESIQERIGIFKKNIDGIVSFYMKKSLIFFVDGLKDVSIISQEIIKALNSNNKL